MVYQIENPRLKNILIYKSYRSGLYLLSSDTRQLLCKFYKIRTRVLITVRCWSDLKQRHLEWEEQHFRNEIETCNLWLLLNNGNPLGNSALFFNYVGEYSKKKKKNCNCYCHVCFSVIVTKDDEIEWFPHFYAKNIVTYISWEVCSF